MVLATRPVLFCVLKIRLQSGDNSIESLNSSPNVRKLLQVCIESARQMVNILTVLQEQDLLGKCPERPVLKPAHRPADSFLPFDLESTFVSATVIVTAAATDSSLLDDWSSLLQKTYCILDEMTSRGNLVAGFRKWELEQLAITSSQLSASRPGPVGQSVTEGRPGKGMSRLQTPLIPDSNDDAFGAPVVEGPDNGFTIAEIMAVADSIGTGDVDWISHAINENQIW